ncbi:response regulator [Alkalibaculum sp. M08DMB]|uniref:Stage 0 sporulation protein A homolog n=1 Tax=Alkalibaculum sporogenes TaxID=2655001 RepID=A0A6A7K876_9FIRM|nr:response regulator [Alkalibaculum sporogenes]MPW25521.1 response regulator [Alkalibaculum sporogenes]
MRIVIVEDEPITRMDLKCILEDAGYEVVGEGSDGFDAINLCKTKKPDIIILDLNMPNLDGVSAAKTITKNKLCKSIVFLTAYSDREFIEAAKKIGVFAYLIKPLDEKSLIPALEIAYTKALQAEDLEKKTEQLFKKLEDRKYIEKAKGILMTEECISEDEAYTRLRMLSMKKGCSIRSICETLLIRNEKN